jgi:hypothetical protein
MFFNKEFILFMHYLFATLEIFVEVLDSLMGCDLGNICAKTSTTLATG